MCITRATPQMKLSTITFCIIVILSACSTPTDEVVQEEVELTPFEQFVDSIPIIKTPYSLSSNEVFEYIEIASKNIPEGASLMGKLNSINGFHFILYSYPADICLPILEVYDADGRKINKAVLFQYGACPITSNGYSKCTIMDKELIMKTVCDAENFDVTADTINIEGLLKVDEL